MFKLLITTTLFREGIPVSVATVITEYKTLEDLTAAVDRLVDANQLSNGQVWHHGVVL